MLISLLQITLQGIHRKSWLQWVWLHVFKKPSQWPHTQLSQDSQQVLRTWQIWLPPDANYGLFCCHCCNKAKAKATQIILVQLGVRVGLHSLTTHRLKSSSGTVFPWASYLTSLIHGKCCTNLLFFSPACRTVNSTDNRLCAQQYSVMTLVSDHLHFF